MQHAKQPLLKDDHLKQDGKPKRKRFSKSFHHGPVTTASPQSLPTHRGSTNSQSYIASSHTASNSQYDSRNVRGTMFSHLNNSQSNEMNEPSVLSSHNGDDHIGDRDVLDDDDDDEVSLDHLDEADLFLSQTHTTMNNSHNNNNNNNNNNTNFTNFRNENVDLLHIQHSHGSLENSLSSLDSEKVPRNQDPLSTHSGLPYYSHAGHGHGHSHHGKVSVIDDDSQLSAMLPGGVHYPQRINSRNKSTVGSDRNDRSLQSLQSIPSMKSMPPVTSNSHSQSSRGNNKQTKSKRMKIGNGKKKKLRAETAYVPSQSLQKTFVSDSNQSHSLQDYYIPNNQVGLNQNMTKVRLNSNSSTQQHRNLDNLNNNNNDGPNLNDYGTKIFRPREDNSYHIMEDQELPAEAKEAKIRAKMRSRHSKHGRRGKNSNSRSGSSRNARKARHKELQKEYDKRFEIGKNIDLINDSEATSSCGSSDEEESGFNYSHMMRRHKQRKKNCCRNYLCCCFCCICDRLPSVDRQYRRCTRSLSNFLAHKCLLLGILMLLWFIAANLYFWLHVFADDGKRYFKWRVPEWLDKNNNFALINLIVGSLCVIVQLYCVSMWYSAHYLNLRIKKEKLKKFKKLEGIREQAKGLESTKKWLSESNQSLERSFDFMTTINENFEMILQKYDINLHKLERFYDDLMVNIQNYQDTDTIVSGKDLTSQNESAPKKDDTDTSVTTKGQAVSAEEDDVKITENEEKQNLIDAATDGSGKEEAKTGASEKKDNKNATERKKGSVSISTAMIHNGKEITLLDGYIRDSLKMLFKLTRMFTKYNYKMESIILKKLKKDLELTSSHLTHVTQKMSGDSTVQQSPNIGRYRTGLGGNLRGSPGVGNSVGGIPSQFHNAPIKSLGAYAVSFQSNANHKFSNDSSAFGAPLSANTTIRGEGMGLSQFEHFITKIPKKYQKYFHNLSGKVIEERRNDPVAYPGPASFDPQQRLLGGGNYGGVNNNYSDLQIAYSDIGSVLSAIIRNGPGSPKKGSNMDGGSFNFASPSQTQNQNQQGQSGQRSQTATIGSRPSLTAAYLSGTKQSRDRTIKTPSATRTRHTQNEDESLLSLNSNNNNNNNNTNWNLNPPDGNEEEFNSSDDELRLLHPGIKRYGKVSTSTDKGGDPSLQISEINDTDGGYLVYGDDDMIPSTNYHQVGGAP